MTEHPPLVEIEQYVRAELPPVDLLRVDDHLAVCTRCRELAGAAANADDRVKGVALASQADSAAASAAHDPPARVIRMADRSPAARVLRWTAFAAAAASAVLAVNLVRSSRPLVAPRAPAMPSTGAAPIPGASAAAALTPEEHRLVDAAIASGRVERPAIVDTLRPPSGALMGRSDAAAALVPTLPSTAAVDDERPTFEWTDAEGPGSYRVAVYDGNYHEVASSSWISGRKWTPDRPLARGNTYTWQVTARTGTRERIAPAPPQPEMRFATTTEAQHASLADLRRRAAGSHLALGVLLAHEGILDEARHELTLAADEKPGSDIARRLLASLDGLR